MSIRNQFYYERTETMTIVYTTAPEDYDYSYVTTLETFKLPQFGSFTTWRKVRIDASNYHVPYQCRRYQSGIHEVRDEDPRSTRLHFQRC